MSKQTQLQRNWKKGNDFAPKEKKDGKDSYSLSILLSDPLILTKSVPKPPSLSH